MIYIASLQELMHITDKTQASARKAANAISYYTRLKQAVSVATQTRIF